MQVLVRQLDIVVAFLQQPVKLRCPGAEAARRRPVGVAVVVETELLRQAVVRGVPVALDRLAGQVGRLARLLGMARHAVAVENRLHQPRIAERRRAIHLGRKPRSRTLQRQRHPRGRLRDARLGLVAPHAGQPLSRPDTGRRTHRLDRQSALIEGLEKDLPVGRDGEMGAAVGFHRHGAKHPAARDDRIARGDHPNTRLMRPQSAGGSAHRQHLEDSEVGDLRPLGPRLQAVVNVDHRDRAHRLLPVQRQRPAGGRVVIHSAIGQFGRGRRRRLRPQRDRA